MLIAYGAFMNHTASNQQRFITRFAPSPTGGLHLGHAYSALLIYEEAKQHNGLFILRIEDIDTTRCKPEFTEDIYTDLKWLGLTWETPVRCQSQYFADYQSALDTLKTQGIVYPCFCTRKDIQSAKPEYGPEGVIYPGTCKYISRAEQKSLLQSGKAHAWRLNLEAALTKIGPILHWHDKIVGDVQAMPELLGDVILARKDTPTSYHLSVVIDDALQQVTHVIRGKDLWHTTHIHVVLQALLNLRQPTYWHHDLLLDESGEKFAKRNESVTLKSIRDSGITAEELKKQLGF